MHPLVLVDEHKKTPLRGVRVDALIYYLLVVFICTKNTPRENTGMMHILLRTCIHHETEYKTV